MRREDDSTHVAHPTDNRSHPRQSVKRPVIGTGASRGVKMTENEINEDVEGHKRPQATEDEDVEGHRKFRPAATEDDDVAGHVRPYPAATDEDDDVEGHKRPL
jgi:hypothetical protein